MEIGKKRGLVGSLSILQIIIDVIFLMALFPAIKGMISTANNCHLVQTVVNENLTTNATVCNMTTAELVISYLIPLVLIVALIYMVGSQLGLFGKNKS